MAALIQSPEFWLGLRVLALVVAVLVVCRAAYFTQEKNDK